MVRVKAPPNFLQAIKFKDSRVGNGRWNVVLTTFYSLLSTLLSKKSTTFLKIVLILYVLYHYKYLIINEY